jgi:hypothetical protein
MNRRSHKKRSRSAKARASKKLVVVNALGPYFEAAGAYNLLEGPIGKQRLSKEVKPLVDAIHQVLAGAVVSYVKVEGPYEKFVVQELDALLNQAIADANCMNSRAKAMLAYI